MIVLFFLQGSMDFRHFSGAHGYSYVMVSHLRKATYTVTAKNEAGEAVFVGEKSGPNEGSEYGGVLKIGPVPSHHPF